MNKQNKKEMKKNKRLEKQHLKLKHIEEKGLKKAKGFISDFKQFATKGNVVDMAVGVIIANAFTKIVNSLVNDIITPAITLLTGKIDYTNLFIALDGKEYATLADAQAAGVSIISYGTFLTNIINFLMVAFWLFVFLKILFRVKNGRKKEEVKVEQATTKKCPYCLNEIAIEATRCGHCTSILEENVVSNN